MLPCDSVADEPISSNSNANFQSKQNIKHDVAQYSVNNISHMAVTTSGIFVVKFWYYSFDFDTISILQWQNMLRSQKMNIALVSLNWLTNNLISNLFA